MLGGGGQPGRAGTARRREAGRAAEGDGPFEGRRPYIGGVGGGRETGGESGVGTVGGQGAVQQTRQPVAFAAEHGRQQAMRGAAPGEGRTAEHGTKQQRVVEPDPVPGAACHPGRLGGIQGRGVEPGSPGRSHQQRRIRPGTVRILLLRGGDQKKQLPCR